jgi:DNA-binding CsgD family transcriptional regulator
VEDPVRNAIEIWDGSGRRLVDLEGERASVGKAAANTVALESDAAVSRLHAVLERFPAGWSVRDLGSRNGTFLNGERVLTSAILQPGDEIRVGGTRLVFRGDPTASGEATKAAESPPPLTVRERDVLVELCRPLLGGDMFCEPASPRRIAEELVVSEDAIKKHLARLYDKFDIREGGERRRVRLANAALARGAVSLSDLRADK